MTASAVIADRQVTDPASICRARPGAARPPRTTGTHSHAAVRSLAHADERMAEGKPKIAWLLLGAQERGSRWTNQNVVAKKRAPVTRAARMACARGYSSIHNPSMTMSAAKTAVETSTLPRGLSRWRMRHGDTGARAPSRNARSCRCPRSHLPMRGRQSRAGCPVIPMAWQGVRDRLGQVARDPRFTSSRRALDVPTPRQGLSVSQFTAFSTL
jgi:hypothetical protein